MDAGAVAVIGRPKSTGSMQPGTESNELVQTIKAMSEVRLVRRWRRPSAKRVQTGANGYPGSRSTLPSIAVVTIGSSTGGPLALQAILERLPADYPVPILIVQHIAPGFVRGLAEWLSASTNLSVRVAEPGDIAGPGHAYLAPDGHQMGLKDNHRIVLNRGDRGNSLCPSITHLFSSAADAFRANVAGVLLTGMGRDGVDGLKVLKDLGALTIAQDRESCVVYGMPGEAVANDAAGYVLSPDGIAAMLVQAVMQPTR
jgi:two-component system chemotaxis response regulator CheB